MKATVPIFGLPVSMKTMARVLAWLRLAHGERFCTIRAFLDISLGLLYRRLERACDDLRYPWKMVPPTYFSVAGSLLGRCSKLYGWDLIQNLSRSFGFLSTKYGMAKISLNGISIFPRRGLELTYYTHTIRLFTPSIFRHLWLHFQQPSSYSRYIWSSLVAPLLIRHCQCLVCSTAVITKAIAFERIYKLFFFSSGKHALFDCPPFMKIL